MFDFLVTTASKLRLQTQVSKYSKAVRVIQKSWRRCKQAYLTRLFLLQAQFMGSLRNYQRYLTDEKSQPKLGFELKNIEEMYMGELRNETESLISYITLRK